MAATNVGPVYVYVGTYTRSLPHVQAKAEGVYVYKMDAEGGDWKHVQTVPDVPNPSYLALHPSGRLSLRRQRGRRARRREGRRGQRVRRRPVERQANLPEPTVDSRRGPLPL